MSENKKGKPKRGVSIYSYSGLFGVSMTLELGAHGLDAVAHLAG